MWGFSVIPNVSNAWNPNPNPGNPLWWQLQQAIQSRSNQTPQSHRLSPPVLIGFIAVSPRLGGAIVMLGCPNRLAQAPEPGGRKQKVVDKLSETCMHF
jgi:hypothetical protein